MFKAFFRNLMALSALGLIISPIVWAVFAFMDWLAELTGSSLGALIAWAVCVVVMFAVVATYAEASDA